MSNPFIYNAVVTDDAFCGREQVIEQITDKIQNSVNILLYSKRRYGKTSLIKEILKNHLPKDTMKIYTDLFSITDETDFARQVSFGIADSGRKKDIGEMIKDLGSILKNIKLSFSTDAAGNVSVTPSFEAANFSFDIWFENVFDNLNSFLKKSNRRGCIVFDEFQQIEIIKKYNIEALLRSKVQNHSNISYIFTGSKQHILTNMFQNAARPFYTLADIIELEPIDRTTFFQFVQKKFNKNGQHITQQAFDRIYSMSFGETRFIQKMCHILYNMNQQNLDEDMATSALEAVIQDSDSLFRNYFPNNFSATQKKVLMILAHHDENLFSKEISRQYDIPTASIQQVLKSLEEKLTIYKDGSKYMIYDVEFYHWLKKIA